MGLLLVVDVYRVPVGVEILVLYLYEYRDHRGLRTLCGRLFKCFRSQIFNAQGCGDADMCEVPIPVRKLN